MFSLAALLAVMWILKRIPPRELQATDTGALEDSSSSSLGVPHENVDRNYVLAFLGPPQFVVAVLLLGATLAFSRGIEFRERVPVKEALDQFPLQIGEWSGILDTMDQSFVDRLDLSDYVIIDYRGSSGKEVNFYVAYYETQRKGESIHSPATCLPGSGWVYKEAGAAALSVTGYGDDTMKVNRAAMEKVGNRQLVYYWFLQRGRVLTNAYELKMFVFWDALTKHRTDGALVRVVTPIYGSEEIGDAEARLKGFLGEVVPVLDEFIPGEDAG